MPGLPLTYYFMKTPSLTCATLCKQDNKTQGSKLLPVTETKFPPCLLTSETTGLYVGEIFIHCAETRLCKRDACVKKCTSKMKSEA